MVNKFTRSEIELFMIEHPFKCPPGLTPMEKYRDDALRGLSITECLLNYLTRYVRGFVTRKGFGTIREAHRRALALPFEHLPLYVNDMTGSEHDLFTVKDIVIWRLKINK